jgi:hypothetical protein
VKTVTKQHRAGLIRSRGRIDLRVFARTYSIMPRSYGPAGFTSPAGAVASTRLRDAVAASLAIASLSLCMMVALAVLSSKLGSGMPIPA